MPEQETEFTAALRARGILPQLESSRSPSPELLPRQSPTLPPASADNELDEDIEAELEASIPTSVLEKWRSDRLDDVKKRSAAARYGSVVGIGREDYKREVTEASTRELGVDKKGKEEDRGTGVVCFLFKNTIPSSNRMARALDRLSPIYPSTKFVSIPGDRCIENYPDKNIPTLLLYRKGDLVKQLVAVGVKDNIRLAVKELEQLLLDLGILDADLRNTSAAGADDDERQSDDDDLHEPSRGFVGGRRRRDDDDDSDLDI